MSADRIRLWLVSVIAPCRCVWIYDEGEVFFWRNRDASRCIRRGHHDDHQVVGLRGA